MGSLVGATAPKNIWKLVSGFCDSDTALQEWYTDNDFVSKLWEFFFLPRVPTEWSQQQL